jgi:hypothetical protein
MKININDEWKNVSAAKVNVGNEWKDVFNIINNDTDEWKRVMGREYYYASASGVQTTTSGTYQTACSVTFQPRANTSYLIIGTWLTLCYPHGYETGGGSDMSGWSRMCRISGTLSTTLLESKNDDPLAQSTLDNPSYNLNNGDGGYNANAIWVESFGEEPTEHTYAIQYRAEYVGYDFNVYIGEPSLLVLELTDYDYYIQDATVSSGTSTSYANKLTLTFTPETAGDYLILTSATMNSESLPNDQITCKARTVIDDEASEYGRMYVPSMDHDYEPTYGFMDVRTLSAAEHTVKLQWANYLDEYKAEMFYACAVAIRLDRFPTSYFARNDTRSTFTNTSFSEATNVSGSLNQYDYLVIGNATWETIYTSTSGTVVGLKKNDNVMSATHKKVAPTSAFISAKHTFFQMFVDEIPGNTKYSVVYSTAAGTGAIDDVRLIALPIPKSNLGL